MRIVLIDYFIEGHHFTFINLFSRALFELGYQVIIMSPSADTRNYGLAGEDGVTFAQITQIPPLPVKHDFFSTRNYVISLWEYTERELNSLELDSRNDLIFFPSLDEYLSAYIPTSVIDRIFKYRWAGLYLKPRYLRVKQSFSFLRKGVLNINYLLNSKRCEAVAVLDPGIIENLKKIAPRKPFFYLPDIIAADYPDKSFPEYKEILGKAAGRKIILLIGAIDHRKGLIKLLQAAKLTDATRYFFVIAGKISEGSFSREELSLLAELSKDVKNAFFYSRKIVSEAEFNAFISLCDILFAAYTNFPYSSNMIGKAVFFNKPIVVSEGYLMHEIVKKYRLGIAVNPEKIEELPLAFEKLAAASENVQGKKDYKEDHSWLRFRDNLRMMISAITIPSK